MHFVTWIQECWLRVTICRCFSSHLGGGGHVQIVDSFNVVMNVPALHDKSDIRRVLESSNSFAPEVTPLCFPRFLFDRRPDLPSRPLAAGRLQDIDGVTSIVPGGVGIKQLLLIIEMAQAELLEEGECILGVDLFVLIVCLITPKFFWRW